MYVSIVMISLWVQQTSQFTPLVLEFSLIRYHLVWGEFSKFFAANAIDNSTIFTRHHHCWVGRGSMEREVCPTLLHTTSIGNQTPDLQRILWRIDFIALPSLGKKFHRIPGELSHWQGNGETMMQQAPRTWYQLSGNKKMESFHVKECPDSKMLA